MKERRKHKRYHISYPVESGRGNLNIILDMEDVSKGGIAFTSIQKLSKSDRMVIRIFMKHKMFNLKAEIVYAGSVGEDEHKIGARFLEVPKSFSAELDKEVEEITEVQKEKKLYDHKDVSFEEAAGEYLKPKEAE